MGRTKQRISPPILTNTHLGRIIKERGQALPPARPTRTLSSPHRFTNLLAQLEEDARALGLLLVHPPTDILAWETADPMLFLLSEFAGALVAQVDDREAHLHIVPGVSASRDVLRGRVEGYLVARQVEYHVTPFDAICLPINR
jgi:hypothetical protein